MFGVWHSDDYMDHDNILNVYSILMYSFMTRFRMRVQLNFIYNWYLYLAMKSMKLTLILTSTP